MKQVNVYFQAVTKVSMAHLLIEQDEHIEDYIKTWLSQGFCKAFLSSGKVSVYIPWGNVVYCQYKDHHQDQPIYNL